MNNAMKQTYASVAVWLATGLVLGELLRRFLYSNPIHIPVFTGLPVFALALALVWMGWRVRALKTGKDRSLSRLAAARVFFMAVASSRAGALITGVSFVVALSYFLGISTSFIRGETLSWGVLCLSSIALLGAGLLAERWCCIDGDDEDGKTSSQPGGFGKLPAV